MTEFFSKSISLQSKGLILQIGFCVTLVISLWSLKGSRKWFLVGWGLTITTIIISILRIITQQNFLFYPSVIIFLIFCVLSIKIATEDVILSGEITLNRLIGSICIYLLIGTTWAILNFLLESVSPNSFSGITAEHYSNTLQEFFYYSFVTLTTLGYGDTLPVKPTARAFAYLEAVSGVLYLALLVASLVGSYLTKNRS